MQSPGWHSKAQCPAASSKEITQHIGGCGKLNTEWRLNVHSPQVLFPEKLLQAQLCVSACIAKRICKAMFFTAAAISRPILYGLQQCHGVPVARVSFSVR